MAVSELPVAHVPTGPAATARDAVRDTLRRVRAMGRWAVETPIEVARMAKDSTAEEMKLRAQDLFAPRDRILAEPPAGSGLKGIPGNWGDPVVGSTLMVTDDRVQWGLEWAERYGDVYWTGLAGRRGIVVYEPDMVQQVLINKDKDFSNDGWQELIGHFFDRGLMLLSFGEHLDHRRIMQSAFTPRQLDSYLAGMDRRITADLESSWPYEGEITLYRRMKDLSMRVAAEVFLGMELKPAQREKLLDGFNAQSRAPSEVVRADIPGTLWGRGRTGYDNVTEFFRREIPNKRANPGDDLFSAMVHAEDDDGAKFTDEEIVRHMNFLWFASHDTTNLAMTMMAWAFAAAPDWQDRAYEESKAIGDEPLQPEDLDRLEAIQLVMNEVMRLWPPVPLSVRQTVRDADLGGYHAPEGTWLAVLSSTTHYLPEYWEDPFTFDPSRFLPPREEHKQHRHVYYPFGAGAHKCIGFAFAQLEAKAMWHRLILTRKFSVEEGYVPPMGWKALPEPLDHLPVTISPR